MAAQTRSSENAREVLLNNSTKKYYIQFGGYRSNHLAHGIVALNRLGSSQERIQQYVDRQAERLEDPQDYAEENDTKTVTESVEELKGQERSYYIILEHFLGRYRESGSLETFVGKEVPALSLGVIGAAFHGLIQLAYGYAASSERTVCEGLAYLHHSYLPLQVSDPTQLASGLGNGDTNIIDILSQVAQDAELNDLVARQIRHPGGAFMARTRVLLQTRGDKLLQYVNKIKLPDFFNPKKLSDQLDGLLKWIVDCTILVYVMAESKNDFFLLHGVTSAWSLKTVLPLVRDADDVISAIRVYLCALLATYVAQGSPALHPEFLPTPDTNMASWEKLIADTLRVEHDTHIYKLVQVCHDMARDNADPQMAAVYKEAAEIALLYPLSGGMYNVYAQNTWWP